MKWIVWQTVIMVVLLIAFKILQSYQQIPTEDLILALVLWWRLTDDFKRNETVASK